MTENRKIILRITAFCVAAIVLISIVAWLSFRDKPALEFSQIQNKENIEKPIPSAEKKDPPVKPASFKEEPTEPEEPEESEPEVIAEEEPEVERASYIIGVSADKTEVQEINKKQASIQSVKPGSVSGFVYDEMGQPIAGAEVRALGRIVDVNLGRCLTDKTGFYKIEDLSSGDYKIEARVLDTGFMGDVFITLAKEEVKTEVDITVLAAYKISGTIYDPAGKPAAGVKVIAIKFSGYREEDSQWGKDFIAKESGELYSPYLDQLGSYAKSLEESGIDEAHWAFKYIFYFSFTPFVFTDLNGKFAYWLKEGPPDQLFIIDPYTCEPNYISLDGDTENMVIKLKLCDRSCSISGYVFSDETKQPIDKFNIRIYPSLFTGVLHAPDDTYYFPFENTGGSFKLNIRSFPGQFYNLLIEVDGFAPTIEPVCTRNVYNDVCEYLIYMGMGGEASICVRDETNNLPVTGVKVVLVEQWRNLLDLPVKGIPSMGLSDHKTSITDKNGCAGFDLLAEAEHCFWVLHPGYEPRLVGPYDITAGQRTDITISLKPRE